MRFWNKISRLFHEVSLLSLSFCLSFPFSLFFRKTFCLFFERNRKFFESVFLYQQCCVNFSCFILDNCFFFLSSSFYIISVFFTSCTSCTRSEVIYFLSSLVFVPPFLIFLLFHFFHFFFFLFFFFFFFLLSFWALVLPPPCFILVVSLFLREFKFFTFVSFLSLYIVRFLPRFRFLLSFPCIFVSLSILSFLFIFFFKFSQDFFPCFCPFYLEFLALLRFFVSLSLLPPSLFLVYFAVSYLWL